MNVNEQTRKIKVINRRIKQVETRIQREVILEDGIVIQDSGPKITTKTIEDYDTQEIEESEDTQNSSKRSVSPVKQYFFGESPSHYTSSTAKMDFEHDDDDDDNDQNCSNYIKIDKNNNSLLTEKNALPADELDRQLPVEYSNFSKLFNRP